MIQMQTVLNVADNTGARSVMWRSTTTHPSDPAPTSEQGSRSGAA